MVCIVRKQETMSKKLPSWAKIEGKGGLREPVLFVTSDICVACLKEFTSCGTTPPRQNDVCSLTIFEMALVNEIFKGWAMTQLFEPGAKTSLSAGLNEEEC